MIQHVGGRQPVRTIHLGGGARIVLQAWAAVDEDRFANIVRIERDQTVSWRAELPAGTARDCFVALAERGGALIATSFSGRTVALDPATGRPMPVARSA